MSIKKHIKLLKELDLNEIEDKLFKESLKLLSFKNISCKKIGIYGINELIMTYHLRKFYRKTFLNDKKKAIYLYKKYVGDLKYQQDECIVELEYTCSDEELISKLETLINDLKYNNV